MSKALLKHTLAVVSLSFFLSPSSSAVQGGRLAGAIGTAHGPPTAGLQPESLASETGEPPVQLEVKGVVFLEIDIPGIGVVKVKVTTCQQGTSGCPG